MTDILEDSIDFKTAVKTRPVFVVLTIVLIIIAIDLNRDNKRKVLNYCEPGILNGIKRSFSHVDPAHLLSNLIVFYILSRIETSRGSIFYIKLIVQLFVLTAVMEYIIQRYCHIPCAIGFSGILYGLLAWEIMRKNNLSPKVIVLSILPLVILPS